MRIIVEIESSSSVGAALLQYIESLAAPIGTVTIYKEPSLTDEEMALPRKQPSPEQIEEWLAQPDYGFIEGKEALAMLKEDLAEYRKRKK